MAICLEVSDFMVEAAIVLGWVQILDLSEGSFIYPFASVPLELTVIQFHCGRDSITDQQHLLIL